jgi:rhodanese-related sulfurtransferase
MTERIELPELRHLIDQDAQLVEVLPPAEYADVHLPGAINIPLKQLDRGAAPRSTGGGRSSSIATTTSET